MAGGLMMSPVLYNSFKDKNRKERISIKGTLVIVLLLVLVVLDPSKVIFAVFFLYMVSGPVLALVRRSQKNRLKRQQQGENPNSGSSPGAQH